MGFIDNSVNEKMIKNRPVLSVVPGVNRRLHASRIGMFYTINLFVVGFTAIFAHRYFTDKFSYQLYDTRKDFRFRSDPYSGKVSCEFRDVSYRQ